MRPRLLLLLLFMTVGAHCFSQCEKKIILSSSQTEILDRKDEVKLRDTVRMTTIKYDSKNFEVISDYTTLYGTIDSIYCDWKLPFKEGYTYIKGSLKYESGDEWVTKLSITGKDGKLSLLVDIEHPQANRMRFMLNKFEEDK